MASPLRLRAAVLGASIALAACTPDDTAVELPPDADAFAEFGLEADVPFAFMPDDQFFMVVESAIVDGERVPVDRVESSDPAIMAVDEGRPYLFTHAPGRAQLRYFSAEGELLGEDTFEVAVPEEVVIVPLAAVLTAPSPVDAARAWEPGDLHVFRSTTVEAIPFHEDRRLIGYNTFHATDEGGAHLESTNAGAFLSPRFFFRLSSSGFGSTGEVALRYGEQVMVRARVFGAAQSDVAALELVDHEGWIWARAQGEAGEVVLGPQVAWNPRPADETEGDMLRYDFDPDAEGFTVVTASYGGVSESIAVRMGDRSASTTRNSEEP